jgi:hypothetical protein
VRTSILGLSILPMLLATAAAHPKGQVGMSGENGKTCVSCHSGGASPRLQVSGPTSLTAGARGIYTLTLTGGAGVVGGVNVALGDPDAMLVATDRRTHLDAGELTHNQPLPFSGGSLTVSFEVVAPASGGAIEIFAAGNSCDGDKTPDGDAPAVATLSVDVSGGGGGGGGAGTGGAGDRPNGAGGGQLPPRQGCSVSGDRSAAGALFWILIGSMLVRLVTRRSPTWRGCAADRRRCP